MKKIIFSLLMLFAISLLSCGPKTDHSEHSGTAVEQDSTRSDAEPELQTDSLVKSINAKRSSIEANLAEPVVITTADLREKVKQKWEKIHFYTTDGQIARIKTYPYANISPRTEEFYLDGGKLILAVIEDNGAGDRGKTAEQIDKMYYFHNGSVIHETRSESETEYGVRASDGEELLVEVQEYLEIFKSKQTSK